MKVTLFVLGERLRKMRKSLQLSQSEVATQLGYPQNTVSKLENGNGCGITFLLEIIHFYKQYYAVGNLFLNKFTLVPQGGQKNSTYAPVRKQVRTSINNIESDISRLHDYT